MKLCAACSQELPKEKFSKKQWQLKQHRRCKECIADNREVTVEEASPSCAGETLSWSDEALFKEPAPKEECPICFLPQSVDDGETAYYSCCGKELCIGCVYAANKADDRGLCPFCRTPASTSDEEYIERLKKRAEVGDAHAIYNLGCYYYHGTYGLRQNHHKANKHFLRAGKLGDAAAYYSVGNAYRTGEGVEKDMKKAKYYYEIAAMGGKTMARHNLGCVEKLAGSIDRAVKHWMISVAAGYDDSLKNIKKGYSNGYVTKDDFETALRSHKEAKDETKSEQREAAARFYGLN